jgi:hypothetical protein
MRGLIHRFGGRHERFAKEVSDQALQTLDAM